MITDSTDQTYASFAPSSLGASPDSSVDSLDAVMAAGVTPASYSEEFAGSGSPFDQPQVADASFQPTLADTPNPAASISPLAIAAGIGLLLMMWGKK